MNKKKKHLTGPIAALMSMGLFLPLLAGCAQGGKAPAGIQKSMEKGQEEVTKGEAESSKEAESHTGDKSLEKVTLCLDWTPNTNHTGIYAAKALGYFEEEGLEVEIVQPPEGGAAMMCASGQAQYAIEAQDTMAYSLAMEEPLEITAVSAILQHNTSGIISRKGEGIDRPSGLTGKVYSTWDSPVELAMLEQVVKEDGGDFSKVKLIPNDITDEPAALAAGQTDAIWVFEGWGYVNSEQEKVPCDFFRFGDISPIFDYYTPVVIANNTYLKENEKSARAFLRALKKGYVYAMESPREAADLLIEGDTTGSLKGSEALVYASQEFLSKNYAEDKESFGRIDENRWNAFYGWLYEKGLIEKDLTGLGFSNAYQED